VHVNIFTRLYKGNKKLTRIPKNLEIKSTSIMIRKTLTTLILTVAALPSHAEGMMGNMPAAAVLLQLGGIAKAGDLGQYRFTTASTQASSFDACKHFFVNSAPPRVRGIEARKPRALCFDSFAVLHSGTTKTPVYVAERLNRQQLTDAKDEVRTNRFYQEARLPSAERATLEDYKGNGAYDRGHLAPAADMPNAQSMAQSFSLANMQPQASENNRGIWSDIEKSTRKYVLRAKGDVYVITGGVFSPNPRTIGAGKVAVPTHIWKLVYDPSIKRAWAYWVENTNEANTRKPISYSELVSRTGIDLLPGAPDGV
jgi:endonuclease G